MLIASYHFIFSITCHVIDSKFKRQFDLLACPPMYEKSTGVNIAAEIQKVCDILEIQTNRIVVMLRDAAASMGKSARVLGVESIDCFIHKLQLCVKDAIKDFGTEIEAARKVCNKFNQSSNFRRDFLRLSDRTLIKVISHSVKLLSFFNLQDEPTRWDSTYCMLRRVIECREFLDQLSNSHKLPDLAYNTLTAMADSLDVAATITKELSTRDATISLILPIYESVRKLGDVESEDVGQRIQGQIAKHLEKRMTTLVDNE
jgi:hypothetical protein